MKRFLLILLPALLFAPVCSFAQNKLPKLELSVGGGAGYGGYLVKFDNSPWIGHISQKESNTIFDLPKTNMWVVGHGGVYLDVNFTDHWGLVTGLEAAYYESEWESENILTTFSDHNWSGIPIHGMHTVTEYWYCLGTDTYESQQMVSLQIPIMGKYMVPISPAKGHQYYVAAGIKLGFHVFARVYDEDCSGEFDRFAYWNQNGNVLTTEIRTEDNNGVPLTCVDTKYDLRSNLYFKKREHWSEIKTSPIDVLASFDTGFRWNLGHGLGLYTGLYCDFGLLRPIPHQEGTKIYSVDVSEAHLNQLDEGSSWSGKLILDKASILAADGPDVPYHDPETGSDVFPTNNAPFAKSIHNLQAGLKLRFSFSLGK